MLFFIQPIPVFIDGKMRLFIIQVYTHKYFNSLWKYVSDHCVSANMKLTNYGLGAQGGHIILVGYFLVAGFNFYKT